MTEALIVLPPHAPIHRAAAFAISMNVRRIVVMGRSAMAGIVSGLDLVRVAAAG
jgi:CBS domain-containing protein